MAKLFGFEFGNAKKVSEPTPVPNKDSSVEVVNSFGHIQNGIVGFSYQYENKQQHAELIKGYRELARKPEAEFAIEEIVSEMVDFDLKNPFTIEIEETPEISKQLKEKIIANFEEMSEIYRKDLGDKIRNWYIDGSKVWFIQLTKNNTKIKELREIDPWMVRKVTPTVVIENNNGVTTFTEGEPYYVYLQEDPNNTRKKTNTSFTGKEIKLAYDSIIYIDSGKYNDQGVPLSFIGAAMKPINDLMSLENAAIIYRLTRAPEKRAFYIDTGQLPTNKAEEYVNSLMKRFKTKLEYDPNTGEVTTANRNVIAATVDYFLPRREGSTGTEVSLISETSNAITNITEEIDYFRKKAFKALKIPASRVDENPSFSLGQDGQITREEVKFSQFIQMLQDRFTDGLLKLLMVSLILDNTMTREEFEDISGFIKITMINNDFFSESKRLDVLNEKINALNNIDSYIGKFFSKSYVYKEILKFTDEEIEEMEKQIAKDPDEG